MPKVFTRLQLQGSARSFGTFNAATFSSVPWENIVPARTRRFKVTCDFMTANANYHDDTAATRYKQACIVKARIPARGGSFESSGASDYTLCRAMRQLTDANATISPTLNQLFWFEDSGATQIEYYDQPHGPITVSLFTFDNTGAEVPLTTSTFASPNYTNDADCGNWWLTLKFECDVDDS